MTSNTSLAQVQHEQSERHCRSSNLHKHPSEVVDGSLRCSDEMDPEETVHGSTNTAKTSLPFRRFINHIVPEEAVAHSVEVTLLRELASPKESPEDSGYGSSNNTSHEAPSITTEQRVSSGDDLDHYFERKEDAADNAVRREHSRVGLFASLDEFCASTSGQRQAGTESPILGCPNTRGLHDESKDSEQHASTIIQPQRPKTGVFFDFWSMNKDQVSKKDMVGIGSRFETLDDDFAQRSLKRRGRIETVGHVVYPFQETKSDDSQVVSKGVVHNLDCEDFNDDGGNIATKSDSDSALLAEDVSPGRIQDEPLPTNDFSEDSQSEGAEDCSEHPQEVPSDGSTQSPSASAGGSRGSSGQSGGTSSMTTMTLNSSTTTSQKRKQSSHGREEDDGDSQRNKPNLSDNPNQNSMPRIPCPYHLWKPGLFADPNYGNCVNEYGEMWLVVNHIKKHHVWRICEFCFEPFGSRKESNCPRCSRKNTLEIESHRRKIETEMPLIYEEDRWRRFQDLPRKSKDYGNEKKWADMCEILLPGIPDLVPLFGNLARVRLDPHQIIKQDLLSTNQNTLRDAPSGTDQARHKSCARLCQNPQVPLRTIADMASEFGHEPYRQRPKKRIKDDLVYEDSDAPDAAACSGAPSTSINLTTVPITDDIYDETSLYSTGIRNLWNPLCLRAENGFASSSKTLKDQNPVIAPTYVASEVPSLPSWTEPESISDGGLFDVDGANEHQYQYQNLDIAQLRPREHEEDEIYRPFVEAIFDADDVAE